MRNATPQRDTGTRIGGALRIDGRGRYDIATGMPDEAACARPDSAGFAATAIPAKPRLRARCIEWEGVLPV